MNVILVFSKNTTLKSWAEAGLLSREILIYKRLIELGYKVTFITNGDRKDTLYKNQIGDIKIICNFFNLPKKYYLKILPIFIKIFYQNHNSVLITQQSTSVKLAKQISKTTGIPFIMRCGYLASDFWYNKYGKDSIEYLNAVEDEKMGLENATNVIVTTEIIKQQLSKLNHKKSEKIKVIPNFIDTNLFKPDSSRSQNNTLYYIGNIGYPKNLTELLYALRKCNIKLIIIAKGAEEDTLKEVKKIIKKYNLNVEIQLKTIPNEHISKLFSRGGLFILPSLHEGNPKVILEAMSCGMLVIGTDVPGINNLIIHNENGLLCGTDSNSIAKAINNAIKNKKNMNHITRNAREYIIKNHSIDLIVNYYENIFKSVIKNNLH